MNDGGGGLTAVDAPRAVQPRGRLFRKYVALFVAVVAVALIANGLLEILFSYREHQDALVRIQREQAEAAAAKIGQFVKEIESQLGWTTQLPWSSATLEQRRVDALRLLRQVPAITELTQLDGAGHEQLRVSRLAMDVVGSGTDLSKEPRFTEAVAHKIYYGPVYFRRESEPYMTLALAGTSRSVGVSVAEVNLKFIWDVVSQIKVGEHGQAFVVDAGGRLIAHPDISLVLRNTDLSSLAQVSAALSGKAAASPEESQEARDLRGHRVLSANARVAPLGWHIFVELPLAEAYAPLYASIERSAGFLLGGLVLAFLAGLLLARRMVVPIERLRAGAARIGRGDLGERIDIKTGDEVEALADQFNDMAEKLQESYADLEKKVERRTQELTEALEQQTATADVLKLISRSTFDLQPVLDTLTETAARLCNAESGTIWRQDGDVFLAIGSCGFSEEARKFISEGVPRRGRGTLVGRTVHEGQPVHIFDVRQDAEYSWSEAVERLGLRSMLGVPLLREGTPIGAFSLHRREVRPFTDKQIELVTTFADQAVIAIENFRLLNELRESLDQQTAMAEVLRVISSSPGELRPVFDAILENATRICEAQFGMLGRRDGEITHTVAMRNVPPAYAEYLRGQPRQLGPSTAAARAWRTKQAVQVLDGAANKPYLDGEADAVALVELGRARTLLAVPMLKDNEAIGQITIFRQEVRAFTDKQIELVTSFASQAVIAMENARLLNELRERTTELARSVEELRALGEVSQAVNSTLEVERVLQTIVAKAVPLSHTDAGAIYVFEAGQQEFRLRATFGMDDALIDAIRHQHIGLGEHAVGQAARTRAPVQVSDLHEDPAQPVQNLLVHAGYRALLVVPLLSPD
ncbi:MAG TPA: GAF domain-containing protein, partial [Stellaceae bacterium]|nr:GAF domain-containing protein [Stellaceae bacterium]